jgi:hypothetical protein
MTPVGNLRGEQWLSTGETCVVVLGTVSDGAAMATVGNGAAFAGNGAAFGNGAMAARPDVAGAAYDAITTVKKSIALLSAQTNRLMFALRTRVNAADTTPRTGRRRNGRGRCGDSR